MDGVGSREESPHAIYISNHPIKQMVPLVAINTLTLHNDRTCVDPLCRRFFLAHCFLLSICSREMTALTCAVTSAALLIYTHWLYIDNHSISLSAILIRFL